ncbi:ABC transporter ATP-binding protein [Xylophilus sp. GOD-11R]|uniref:ABC transporter ATP-binding protein n=1 Tax=Xylophilus sp. GOD-11R TaxID=3089814 RepID=UPI00298D0264|nr:ABC transporter ATP-binding protein [Xylophilus sp. GOD-11R]WPB55392.1 ABC transporter ATP-binding protein [Xylophilus sp. GOD-11R]
MALLDIQNLQTWFDTRSGVVKAVDGVSLSVDRGETVALVGESGSGKSVTAYSILRLIPPTQGRIAGGRIVFDGTDLVTLPDAGMRALRGNRISMVFQEPLSALNPVLDIGEQVAEAIRLHRPVSRTAARAQAVALLDRVGLPMAARRAADFPHQLSGGMRQRVVIAIALACEPDLLIADEPTTALDVTTQAQILELLKELQQERGMGLLLITHDLGVVAEVADRAAVMYAGRVVEQGAIGPLFDAPSHPYTAGLLASMELGDLAPASRLPEIAGVVPSLLDMPAGCAFAPRCGHAQAVCREARPSLNGIGIGTGGGIHGTHRVACFLPLTGHPTPDAPTPHPRELAGELT